MTSLNIRENRTSRQGIQQLKEPPQSGSPFVPTSTKTTAYSAAARAT